MIHALLEFIGNSVRAGSKPGSGRNEWTFVLLVVVVGLALGVALYAVAS